MAHVHMPSDLEFRQMPGECIRQVVDTHLYPEGTGLRQTHQKIGDDTTVTLWWRDHTGQIIIRTVRGLEAVRQHRLHQRERDYHVHEHKSSETTRDIAAYCESIVRGN